MQRQWARLARRGWCAGVVPTAPRSLESTWREMRQAEPPSRGGAAQASLGFLVAFGCSLLLSQGGGPGSGGWSLPHPPGGWTSLHTAANGGSFAGPRREKQCTPPTPPTRQLRQRAYGANSRAVRLQPPSLTPLRSGGVPLWATALSPEPGPRGRAQLRPATPVPKTKVKVKVRPSLTLPPAFQQNTGTRK